ncbi:hypothetical protein HPP92_008127 [Vanilla planifolia]|uniref:Transmembrane protein n=1 Tax=Vanilla planifolia TaxID=51239 RepID=A0A835R2E1_VANPL|nr:hypothetical protein HPP92_008284 [Vanilla planifolia]KAG0486032.1 hypothetical protein HPP92_008127 [Vanilla planifolia]
MEKLQLFFCIEVLLLCLLSSSVAIHVHMASQGVIPGRRMLGGRISDSPPAPAGNPIKHHLPPVDVSIGYPAPVK